MKFADLHVHTVYSDGTSTPQELIACVKKAGISAVSVVDHDTVEGIGPTIAAAGTNDIEVIPGIELTAEHEGTEIHILGYLLDYTYEDLKKRLGVLRNNRIERVYKIVEKLKDNGVDLNPQIIFDIAQNGTVGRLHIARAMVQEGKVSSIGEAFFSYLGDKSPAYVCGFKFSPEQAIQLIKDAGGIPVLAHPYVISQNDLILLLIKMGIMGLEVFYPEHSQSMVNYFTHMAKEYDLLMTGGSDFHGSGKPDVKVGCTKIPYEYVERMKQRCAQR